MGKYLFLDTNIYLHYKPLEQLELDRFGQDSTLVVSRIILGELNKHKDSHSSRRIRNRARKVCKSIHEWSDDGAVSDNLAFEFDIKTSSPQDHGLDPSSSDDRFLADILEHPAPTADKILLSNDSNLCLTAKHLGIHVEEVDDRFMLPAELDLAEIEARELRKELDQIRNARPKLEVGLVNGVSHLEVTANPLFPIHPSGLDLTDDVIEQQVEEKRRSLRDKRMSMPTQTGLASALVGRVSASEIEVYHQKLDVYPDHYRKYLQARRLHLMLPMYRFTVGIANTGTAPAQNVDIYLHFPDGFMLYDKNNIPQGPREPDLPHKPMSSMESLQQAASFALRDFNFTPPHMPSSFTLKRTNSYDVEDSFRLIKHNERACLPELFLQFSSIEAAKPFRCDYRVTVDNLPEEITGKINFQFVSDGEEA